MKIGNYKIEGRLETSLLSLALKMEILEGSHFRTNKIEDMKKLILLSEISPHHEIQKIYESLIPQIRGSEIEHFFNIQGLNKK